MGVDLDSRLYTLGVEMHLMRDNLILNHQHITILFFFSSGNAAIKVLRIYTSVSSALSSVVGAQVQCLQAWLNYRMYLCSLCYIQYVDHSIWFFNKFFENRMIFPVEGWIVSWNKLPSSWISSRYLRARRYYHQPWNSYK